jgi:Nif-specific regulatory protein
LNCAAISESLLASELFGHEKGSFTGATERKIGKFEAANGGTLFLDEIGEMSQALQAKFLRVLEGHPFERVGGNTPITVDARVIAATNRDLEREVAEGRFRHDLFFRLRVLEIIVPPLRKRHEDIPILANHFLDKFSKETGRKYQGYSSEAMDTLLNYTWPGNIRELKNVVERAVVLSTGPYIQPSDLLLTSLNTTSDSSIHQQYDASPANISVFDPISLDEIEKHHITKTLEYFQWNKSLVAKNLGIERTTLDRKIKRYGIDKTE